MLVRTEGVVIRTMDYGEGNIILTLFTKDTGRASVMARGAKKLKSRHSAAAQLFTHGEYVYYRSGHGQMGTLNNAEIIRAHHALREDLHKSAYSAYLTEMVWRTTDDDEPDPFLFEQLLAGLAAIEKDKNPAIVTNIFEMLILDRSGYAPELDACVSCGRTEPLSAFSHSLGGALCPSCRPKDPAAADMPENALKLLRLFRRADLRRLGQVSVKPENAVLLKQLIRGYMDQHMEVRWKSRKFLEQMEKSEL